MLYTVQYNIEVWEWLLLDVCAHNKLPVHVRCVPPRAGGTS